MAEPKTTLTTESVDAFLGTIDSDQVRDDCRTNASIMGITGMFGPVLFTQSFSRAIAPGAAINLPGAPFFLAGMLVFSALLLAQRVTRVAA